MSEPKKNKSKAYAIQKRANKDKGQYLLISLGCAKNQVESEHLAGLLIQSGYQATEEIQEADLVIVNTCGFIKDAVEEAVEAILNAIEDKQEDARLVVAGCLVGRYGKKLVKSLPEVDLFLAPGEAGNLLEHIEQSKKGKLAISTPRWLFRGNDPRALSTGPGWAYLRVADGCAWRCHFCTIPMIRGKLRSRELNDIVDEAKRLADLGVREINLIAQDLTSYGRDLPGEKDLDQVFKRLNSIKGIDWIRPLYLHPDHLKLRTIENMAALEKVVPYFDLPLQHIAEPVLKAMGRRKDGEELKELLSEIRQLCPEAVIRATLLVGHPGEGEAEFKQLIKFVEKAELDHMGCFAFSPEAGTRSAMMKAPASKTAQARKNKIMELQRGISRRKLERLVGQEREILVLGEHPESELLGVGRLASQAPEVDGTVIIVEGQAQAGTLARCRITASHDYDHEAELI